MTNQELRKWCLEKVLERGASGTTLTAIMEASEVFYAFIMAIEPMEVVENITIDLRTMEKGVE